MGSSAEIGPPRPCPAAFGSPKWRLVTQLLGTGRVAVSDKRLEGYRSKILDGVRQAPKGQKHFRLRNAALALGGIQEQAGFSEQEAVTWLMDALPSTVEDWAQAEKTARWGLLAGREKPITLEDRELERSVARVTSPDTDEAPPQPQPLDRGTPHGKLVVFGVHDIETAPPRDYLMKGLISPAEISIWCGPPKCGKSFLMLHVAYLLSLGQSVFKRRVKQCPVLYVAAEGEAGIANRIRALRDKYDASEAFHFIAQPADLLHQEGHLDDLIAAAKAVGARLIILDTLSRMMAGGDENAPTDMGQFIANVTRLRHETGAHIAIVHHGTKSSNGTTPRGHSSLTGADDALIEVIQNADGSRVATIAHAKDDASGERFGFQLDKIPLELDDDGDPVTTLLVREETIAAAKAGKAEQGPKLSPMERTALGILDKALKAEATLAVVGEDSVERSVLNVDVWRNWFYKDAQPGAEPDVKRKAFTRARDALLEKGCIQCADLLIWRA